MTKTQKAKIGEVETLRAQLAEALRERDEAREAFSETRRLVAFLAHEVANGAGCCEAGRGSRLRQVLEHMYHIVSGEWAKTQRDLLGEAWAERDAALAHAAMKYRAPRIIKMLLWCPECGQRHVDRPGFLKPHHTHACQHCGHCWRPAIIFTEGVQFLPGFKNTTRKP